MGLWLGPTVPGGDNANPKGFFENAELREEINKGMLLDFGCDPLGVGKLPELQDLRSVPALKQRVLGIIARQGYDGGAPWGFKDAKLSLLWPLWRDHFPAARWLIVKRPRELVIKSCLKTHFMRQHSTDPAFWERFCDAYEARLTALKSAEAGCWEIDADALVQGDLAPLRALVEKLGLAWREEAVSDFVEPRYWGDNNPGTAPS